VERRRAILLRMEEVALPILDDEVHGRLGRRYGVEIDAWLEGVPPLVHGLARRWRLDRFDLVRRGTVSLVMRCRTSGGSSAVLKLSPDHSRINAEAGALAAWRTRRLPELLAHDATHGAVLMEAIRPGTALDESGSSPSIPAVAALLSALHDHRPSLSAVQPVGERIAALFRSGEANYHRRPDLQELIPRALYERGRRAAESLAADPAHHVVLHGDLTPANVLDGGSTRGLVAVDPAPCWGDAAFDTVDLLMWRLDDLATLSARAQELGDHLGSPPERLLRWCAAFAASSALEEAEGARLGEPPPARIRMLIDLSSSI
jgi:streptomycin 6-kinase